MDRLAVGAAMAATALAAGLAASCGTTGSSAPGPVYSYDGCVDDPNDCPGKKAFECALGRIAARHARCSTRRDCVPAEAPDAGGLEQDDCINSCIHSAVNADEIQSYLEEARIEVRHYCASHQCAAQLNCPRPLHATAECVDGGCVWTVGIPIDAGTRDAGAHLDAGVDAGPRDAGASDAGARDAGSQDAGARDAGSQDAGARDAGAPDGGGVDAGGVDAGVHDAGVADAGAQDAGGADAGIIDAGSPDAGAPDAAAGGDAGAEPDASDAEAASDAEVAPDSGSQLDSGALDDGGSSD
jgi:hypothetical protein